MVDNNLEAPWRLDKRAHDLINATVAFAAILSPAGVTLDVSKNALDAAGISLSDIVDRRFWEGYWFGHDPALQARLRDVVERGARGETSRFDIEVRVRGDRRLIVDFQIAPLRDDNGKVTELIASGFDVSERERQKENLNSALRETSHRIKNILSTLSAMGRMTRIHGKGDRFDSFLKRLDALAAVHSIFGDGSKISSAPFDVITRQVLNPFLHGHEKVEVISGKKRILRDQAKQLGLCIHELATNSSKHGALHDGGTLSVSFTDPDGAGVTHFSWSETHAPKDTGSYTEGFGLPYVRNALRSLLMGEPVIEMQSDRFQILVDGPAPHIFEQLEGAGG